MAMTQNFARDTVTTPATKARAKAVVVKNLKTSMILYAQLSDS